MGKGFGVKTLKGLRDRGLLRTYQELSKDTIKSADEMKLMALQFIPSDVFADFFAWNMQMQGHQYSPEQINYEAYKLLNSDPRRLSQWLNTGLFYSFAHEDIKRFCVRTAEILATYVTGFECSEDALFNCLLKGVTILDHECSRSYEDLNEVDEDYIDNRFKDVDKDAYDSLLSEDFNECQAYATAWLIRQKHDACNLFAKTNPKSIPENKQTIKNNLCKLFDRVPDHQLYEFLIQFYDWAENKAEYFSKLK